MSSSSRPRYLLALAPLGLLFVPPRVTGVLPGELLVPPNLTSAFPACGNCHDPQPNANGPMTLKVTPADVSVSPGQKTQFTLAVSGGPNQGIGGFAIEINGGAFSPTVNTRTLPNGRAATHTNNFNSSWTFDWTAPATPGLVTATAAGQSVNGDITPTGDSWGFFGPNSSQPGTLRRLFVNSANVVPFGKGCAGADDHVLLLGAAADARIGQTFTTEAHAMLPGALAACVVGFSTTVWSGLPLPFDLGLFGFPGCFLLTDHFIVQSQVAGGSGSGGGTATYSWAIPSDTAYRGVVLYFQSIVIEGTPRIVTSNGLRVTIQ